MEVVTLGSGSPRRKQLLEKLNIPTIIKTPKTNEEMNRNLTAEENAIKISNDKLQYIIKHNPDDKWILTADTFISYNNKTLGKPRDREDAYNMLQMLSNNIHRVLTGVTIYSKREQKTISEVDITYVTFKNLSKNDIDYYLDFNEWIDAAGAYQIQNMGEILIESINGSYSSVMGLPISRIYGMFTSLNFYIREPGSLFDC